MVDTVGHEGRHCPRQGRAPVVAHDMCPLNAESIEDAQHVADKIENAVLLDSDRHR